MDSPEVKCHSNHCPDNKNLDKLYEMCLYRYAVGYYRSWAIVGKWDLLLHALRIVFWLTFPFTKQSFHYFVYHSMPFWEQAWVTAEMGDLALKVVESGEGDPWDPHIFYPIEANSN
jgi:hypothetical protein